MELACIVSLFLGAFFFIILEQCFQGLCLPEHDPIIGSTFDFERHVRGTRRPPWVPVGLIPYAKGGLDDTKKSPGPSSHGLLYAHLV